MRRRNVVAALAAGWTSGLRPAAATERLPQVAVFKNPSCGCCDAWVEHLRAAGFPVRVAEVDDPGATRRRHGLPDRFGSCHTALVAGYVVEGHVPAHDIRKLLATKPAAIGLAVPGMPVGSPGMEVGDRRDAYEVLLIDRRGNPTVYARYPAS